MWKAQTSRQDKIIQITNAKNLVLVGQIHATWHYWHLTPSYFNIKFRSTYIYHYCQHDIITLPHFIIPFRTFNSTKAVEINQIWQIPIIQWQELNSVTAHWQQFICSSSLVLAFADQKLPSSRSSSKRDFTQVLSGEICKIFNKNTFTTPSFGCFCSSERSSY